MSMVSAENYIVIQGWMLTELSLKGNELLVFAIIYGFSQNSDDQYYSGSLQYLAEWTNSTKRTVMTILKNLNEKGYIVKHEEVKNGVRFCRYCASDFTSMEKISPPHEKVSPGGSEKLSHGGEKVSPNNLDNNLDNKKIAKKPRSNVFTPPTVDEVEAYCQEMGYGIDPDRFVDYYTANGWMAGKTHMKDWKAAVRNWERSRKEKKNNGKRGGSLLEQIMNA
jgi:hypothetical protein